MNKKMYVIFLLVLGLCLIVGCATNTSSNNGETIRVGLNYELSGSVATYGQGLTEGIELAVEEINNSGGVLGKQLELIKLDNKSEDTESANIATRLATRDNVVAILGAATSGNTKAAIPAAMANKIPIISGSATADDITMDSDGNIREYVFKTCFSDSYQGIVMAEFATNDLGIKKVAILADSTSDYAKGLSKSFKETFEKYGGKILIEEAYKSKDTDFKAVLTSIKSVNPDAIFIPGYYEEVGLIVRQARELGLDVPILGGDGYESPKFAEISGKEAANNVFYSNHYSPMDDSEEVVGFRERFKKKYNKEPNGFNALGYDLAYLLKDALERAEEANPEKLKKALESTKDFKGVTGTITIDENHNPIKSTTIIELKDGVPVFLKKLDPK